MAGNSIQERVLISSSFLMPSLLQSPREALLQAQSLVNTTLLVTNEGFRKGAPRRFRKGAPKSLASRDFVIVDNLFYPNDMRDDWAKGRSTSDSRLTKKLY